MEKISSLLHTKLSIDNTVQAIERYSQVLEIKYNLERLQ